MKKIPREYRLPIGLGIVLTGIVYGVTSPDLQPYLYLEKFRNVIPTAATLYRLMWGFAFLLFIFLSKGRRATVLQIGVVVFGFVFLTAVVFRTIPLLVWGALSWEGLALHLTEGAFRGIPKGAPWYCSVGQLFYALTCLVAFIPIPILTLIAFLFPFDMTMPDRFHRRGRKLLSYREAAAGAEEERKKEGEGPTLYWGWLHLPWSFGTKHFAACGSTGSGKTTLIRFLMQSVLPRIGECPDERALIYDAKQDILSILDGMNLPGRIVLLNPFDSRSSAWDIAADVTEPSTAQQIATILIPEEKNAAQRFFSDAARHLLAGVMRRFIKTAPGRWTLADVVYAMLDQKRIEQILSSDPETASLLTYLQDARTGNSVLSTVLTKMQPYEFIAAAWSHAVMKVSLRDWVKGDYILILGNDEAQRSALDAINQAIFKRIVELVLAQDNSTARRTWFFLDEVREAGRLEGLQSLLTKGRSKGACAILGFQDIDGMKEVYGEHLASEICGQCACKAILRTDSAKTAEWGSALLGEREFVEITHGESSQKGSSSGWKHSTDNSSHSTSMSEHIVKRPIVLPSEIMNLPLPGGEGKGPLDGYFLVPNIGAYEARITWNSIEEDLSKPSNVPNLVRRSAEHEVLSPWGTPDHIRLGLESGKTTEVSQLTIEAMGHDQKRTDSLESSAPMGSLRDAARHIRNRG